MKALLIFLLLICPARLLAQHLPDYGISQVRISDTDRTIRAGILALGSSPKTRPDRQYYWYGSGSIHQLQGGYSGHLLNGSYQEYYLNKNLRTEGTFEEGLKDGVWKEWNEAGKLSRLVTWNKGVQNGPFQLYNTEGRVVTSGIYKNNQFDGSFITNPGTDSAKIIRYKNGKVQPVKSGSFLKWIHLFPRNKTRAAKPVSPAS